MTAIRKAAVANMFYPGNAAALRAEVRQFLDAAGKAEGPAPKAIVAPHAGYRFSGAIAAKAYALLKPVADRITRVVLLGPCHRVAVQGLALSGADYFETPLGRVEIDKEAEDSIRHFDQVGNFPPTHQAEHALEVHLPFLQELLGDFKLVPIVVGETPPSKVAEVLKTLWGGPETLIVISSDLSHFHDYDTAKRIDDNTRVMIERFDAESITSGDACGALPIAGMLMSARKRGMRIRTLGMCNSGDVTGDKSRVVGYGAWAVYAGSKDMREDEKTSKSSGGFVGMTEKLLADHGAEMIDLARQSIWHGITHGGPLRIDPASVSPALLAPGACFVTLKKSGQLRGCIGSVMAHRDLATDLCENAFKAGFGDPRFPALRQDELNDDLELSISVLSPPRDFPFENEADLIAKLTPDEDGIILSDGNHRGLFLPQVWEQLPDPADFVAQLKRKAGLSTDHWSDRMRAQRFVTRGISGKDISPRDFWQQPTPMS